MNAEKVYVIVSDIKDQLLYKLPEEVDVIPGLEKWLTLAKAEMYEIELQKNKELIKYKAMQRVLSRAASDSRGVLKHSYIHKDGLQYVCDSFVLIGSKKHFDFSLTEDYFEIDRIKPSCTAGVRELKVPDLFYLKAEIKVAKSKKLKAVYCFGEGFQMVNANFLVDVLEGVPNASACTYPDRFGNFSKKFIEFKNSAGDYGLLLPLLPGRVENKHYFIHLEGEKTND